MAWLNAAHASRVTHAEHEQRLIDSTMKNRDGIPPARLEHFTALKPCHASHFSGGYMYWHLVEPPSPSCKTLQVRSTPELGQAQGKFQHPKFDSRKLRANGSLGSVARRRSDWVRNVHKVMRNPKLVRNGVAESFNAKRFSRMVAAADQVHASLFGQRH